MLIGATVIARQKNVGSKEELFEQDCCKDSKACGGLKG